MNGANLMFNTGDIVRYKQSGPDAWHEAHRFKGLVFTVTHPVNRLKVSVSVAVVAHEPGIPEHIANLYYVGYPFGGATPEYLEKVKLTKSGKVSINV